MRFLISLAYSFPLIVVKAPKLQKALYNLGYDLDAGRWFSLSLFFSLSLSLIMTYFFGYVGGLIVFILSFAVFYYLPIVEDKKRQAVIESEMPIFLRDLGSLLNMDIPFIVALRILSKREGEIAKELRKALREIEKGASITKAIQSIADRVDSNDVKRAIAQIMSSYEQGGSGEGLRRLGNDMINMQKFKMAEYASKSSLMGLGFIMLSVVGPTFFIIISLVGPAVFGGEVDVEGSGWAFLALFPILSFGLIVLMKSATPPTTFREKAGFNYTIIFISILTAVVFVLDVEVYYKIIFFIAIFVVLLLKNIDNWLKEKELESIEEHIPNALLSIASLPRGAKVEKIFQTIARMNFGRLSYEFKKALKEIESGLSPLKVVESMKDRIPLESFSRVVDVFIYSLQSGQNIGDRMAELADDFFLFMDIKRKRAELMSMQKYTLMIGVVLMALILSMSLNLVEQMSSTINKELDMSWYREYAIPAYITITAALVSDFASYVDGKKSKSYVYFALLSLISLGLFFYNTGVLNEFVEFVRSLF